MPVTLSNIPVQDLDQNSPFANPATCPTHIEVDGYGRIPVSIMKKSFWSDTYSPVRPDVHERVLYTQPVRAADMLHAPEPTSVGAVFGWSLLAGLGGAAIAVGALCATPAYGVLLGVGGALAWLIGLSGLITGIAPPRQATPQAATHEARYEAHRPPQVFADLNRARRA